MAVELAKSIVDLLSCLWNCAVPHVDYIRKLKENKDALKKTMDELKALRDDTMTKVREAEQEPAMKQTKQVEIWLSGVRDREVEVEKLIRDASQEIEKKCLGGCCPKNCKTSYKLGKIVAKKLKEVADLKSRGSFEAVADKRPLPLVEERLSEPTVGLEPTFEKVWSYIEDEQPRIIGLYGLGGVGKTTLLTQINNKFSKTDHRFDVVIWTVVSSNPNSAKVQEDIWKRIGNCDSQWKEKTKEDKAKDIFEVLSKKKFVLLLDDIWARFELSDVGVPPLDEQNMSKVVFTTRSVDVCSEMEAHHLIKIKSLAPEEAWDLFQRKVGEGFFKIHPHLLKKAKTVAKECDGLPLALIIIGRAMACRKTHQEWQDAVTMLRKSTANTLGLGIKVYSRLKFSYDNLSPDILKSCFLYCSLFREDFSISREGLIEYWIGEGFLGGFDDLNEAQNKGQTIIGSLIRSCLLEEDSSSSVKMHDVIRDMALWIAGECEDVKEKFLVRAGMKLTEAPEVKNWEGVERVSLMSNDIGKLTEVPMCPYLSTLFLNSNKLEVIQCGFFQNMPNLRVLDLSQNYKLSKLPEDTSKLVKLQYLNLSWTRIQEFPIGFKELVELEYLNFEDMGELRKIQEGVLSSFNKLRVLKMAKNNFFNSEVEDSEFQTLVKEVECLNKLNELTISIRTTSALSRFLSRLKLQTFTTKLSLTSLAGSENVDICGLQSMRCLREFSMENCDDLKHLKVEKANEESCFHSLREVKISMCAKLEELNCLIFAPNLEILEISFCNAMKEVIGSEATKEGGHLNPPFAKLKRLELIHLQQMKSIYPTALPFLCLNSIVVYQCENLKKLPLNSDSAEGCGLVIKGRPIWWNDLDWENEPTQNPFLLSFQAL